MYQQTVYCYEEGGGRGSQCTLYTNKSVDTGEQTFETHYFMSKCMVSDYEFPWLSSEAKIYGKYLIFILLKSIRLLH
jgi:hypothetical protein